MWTSTRARLGQVAALIISFVLFGSGAAFAQDEKPKKMKDRVADLETKVERIDDELNDLTGPEKPEKIREARKQLEEELAEVKAQIEDIKSAVEEAATAEGEQTERLDATSDEITSLWERLDEQQKKLDEALAHETVGYDKGFFISSKDGKHKLVINGFMKPYYQVAFQDVYGTDSYGAIAYDETGRPLGGDTEVTASGFGVASTRLSISGQVFGVIRVLAEIDYSNLYGQISYPANADVPEDAASGKVKIDTYALRSLAAYGEFAPMQELKIRAGQLKIPFDKETLAPTSGLTFTSRSLMNRAYVRWGEETATDAANYGAAYEVQRGASFGYDRGLMVHGKMKDAIFAYAVGVFNGGGANVGNDNRDVAVAVRLSSDILGEMSAGLSDLEALKTPRLSVGAAFVWDLPQHKHFIDGETYNSEDANVTGDIQLKWMGLSMFTSFFFRRSDHGAAYYTDINTFGYMGQLAYCVPKIMVEPAFRYSVLDANSDRSDDHVHEFTAALNYYIYGKNLKIGAEWSGMFAANKEQSFMAPWGAWYEDEHKITIMAQAAF